MENIKTWANTHSWVKIAVYLLTFLFPALAFAQFYLPSDFCFSVRLWADFMGYCVLCTVFVSLYCLYFSYFKKHW